MECPTEWFKSAIYRFFQKLLPAPCAKFHAATHFGYLALKNAQTSFGAFGRLSALCAEKCTAAHMRPA